MRVHVVSDVHGRTDALRAAADGADALLCLGDMLLFIDYADNAQGIFSDLFGAEATQRFVALRTAKRFDEARDMARCLWDGLADMLQVSAGRIYQAVAAADWPEPVIDRPRKQWYWWPYLESALASQGLRLPPGTAPPPCRAGPQLVG